MSYFNRDQREALEHEARVRCRETQASLNDAFNHLCAALPAGWEIQMVARSDEAEIELYDPNGKCVSEQWDGDGHDVYNLLVHTIESK